jgi:carboxypeptidase T
VDRWWRKNRNPNTTTGPGTPGVDLNRNFDFLWSSGIGTSPNAASEVYKGGAHFSEPETQNVRFLLDRFPTIQYYMDIHSYSGLILYPWGDDDNQSVDPSQNFRNPAFDGQRGTAGVGYREFMPASDQHGLVDLADRMNAALAAVRGTHYTVQQSVGLYPTSATSDDYAFSRHLTDPSKRKVYPFTIEFGNEFIPPFAEMQHIILELCSAMTELCLAVSAGP